MIRAIAIACLIASPANATRCFPAPDLLAALSGDHGEQRRFEGLGTGGIAELWVNDATGTWTVVVLTPRGLGCIVAAGDNAGWVEPVPVGTPG